MKSFSNTPVQYVFTVVSDHSQVMSSDAPYTYSQKNLCGIKFGSLASTANYFCQLYFYTYYQTIVRCQI